MNAKKIAIILGVIILLGAIVGFTVNQSQKNVVTVWTVTTFFWLWLTVKPTIAPSRMMTPKMMAIFFAFMNYLPARHGGLCTPYIRRQDWESSFVRQVYSHEAFIFMVSGYRSDYNGKRFPVLHDLMK